MDAVQVAGIVDPTEARMLIECGADFIGVPYAVPVRDEGLTENDITRVSRDPGCRGKVVLITYLEGARDITALCRRVEVNIVQLHGEIEHKEIAKLRAMEPELCIIKSLVIGRFEPTAEFLATAPFVDAFITDTYDAATGARGATGKTHDWRKSRDIVQQSERPVMLAGGLTPGNVGRAIMEVSPAAVDVHTGVEDELGRKDKELVSAFVTNARAAFAARRRESG